MNPYNEREVLALLQDERTQKQGFEQIVSLYSEQLYWQIRRMKGSGKKQVEPGCEIIVPGSLPGFTVLP